MLLRSRVATSPKEQAIELTISSVREGRMYRRGRVENAALRVFLTWQLQLALGATPRSLRSLARRTVAPEH